MAVQPILLYPDPRLKQVCTPVNILTDSVKHTIRNLADTFDVSPGCVGIAAPQTGCLLRIIIVDASNSKKTQKNTSVHNRIVCINPEITQHDGTIMFREGCLSIPDFTGNVIRHNTLTVRYLDERFTQHEIQAHGFESVVLQHEIDHLDGILFLDRVRSFTHDVFRRKKYL